MLDQFINCTQYLCNNTSIPEISKFINSLCSGLSLNKDLFQALAKAHRASREYAVNKLCGIVDTKPVKLVIAYIKE